MTTPAARSNETDGNVGVSPSTSGLPLAVLGPALAGTVATPGLYARDSEVISTFTSGPVVSKALYGLRWFGRPVIVVRVATATPGSYGAVDETLVAGTSTPSTDGATNPDDDYEAKIKFPVGGTIGTAGIKYQTSLDGGQTYGPLTALGTATFIIIPGSGGVKVNFAAGTIVANDVLSFSCIAPVYDSTGLDAALTALRQSSLGWDIFDVTGIMTSALATTCDAQLATMTTKGRHRMGIGHFRVPNAGESRATYRTAFETAFSAYASAGGHMMVTAGDARVQSTFPGRPGNFRRQFGFGVGAKLASVSEEIEIADLDPPGGALPGYSVKDSLGNPEGHDELEFPGLDDLRACVGRTWPDRQGVFVNKSTLLSPSGSDFQIAPHRRVMNLARTVLDFHMPKILFKPRRVDRKTGFLAETELRSIEKQINAIMNAALTTKPKAEFVQLTLNRNDPVLKPPYPLTGKLRVISLAYVMDITIDVGWFNPAALAA